MSRRAVSRSGPSQVFWLGETSAGYCAARAARLLAPMLRCRARCCTVPRCMTQISAVFLTYNCASFVREAIRSVFGQDWAEPLEVIVSDDASTDGTYDILCSEVSAYRGPYAVALRQRQTNSGSKSAHLNDVLPSVTGDIIVSFDADDVSERSRIR